MDVENNLFLSGLTVLIMPSLQALVPFNGSVGTDSHEFMHHIVFNQIDIRLQILL